MIELIPTIVLAMGSLTASVPTAEAGVTAAPVRLRAERFIAGADVQKLHALKHLQAESSVPLSRTELYVELDNNGELVARCRVVGSPNLQGLLRPDLMQRELPR